MNLNVVPWIFSFGQFAIFMVVGIVIANIKDKYNNCDYGINWRVIFPKNVFSVLISIFAFIDLLFCYLLIGFALNKSVLAYDFSEVGLDIFVFLLALSLDFYGLHYLALFKLASDKGLKKWLGSASSKDVLELPNGSDGFEYRSFFVISTKNVAVFLFFSALLSLTVVSVIHVK